MRTGAYMVEAHLECLALGRHLALPAEKILGLRRLSEDSSLLRAFASYARKKIKGFGKPFSGGLVLGLKRVRNNKTLSHLSAVSHSTSKMEGFGDLMTRT